MNRLKIILRENETLHEMLIGIVLSNLVILLIGLIVSKNRLMAGLGVLEGALLAVFYCIHMAVTIDDAMCLDEKGAASQMRKHMLIRYMIVCICIGAISYFRIGDPILCIFSCLTIKLGAYLQPIIHNKINRSIEPTAEAEGQNMEVR